MNDNFILICMLFLCVFCIGNAWIGGYNMHNNKVILEKLDSIKNEYQPKIDTISIEKKDTTYTIIFK